MYRKITNVFFTFLLLLLAFPYRFILEAAGEGLDKSWVWGQNYYLSQGFSFGGDVGFTYGPLGFLVHCLYQQAYSSLIFWIFLGIFSSLILYLIFDAIVSSKKDYIRVILFTILFLLFFYFPSAVYAEYYLLFWYCVSTLFFVLYRQKMIFLIFSTFILGFSVLIKFSLAIQELSLLVSLIVLSFLFKFNCRYNLIVHGIVSICTSAIIYLFVDAGHSIVNFGNFIWASIQQASGYNYAMSLSSVDNYKFLLATVIAMFAVNMLVILNNLKNKENLVLLISLLGPEFFLYKHGFVRGDGHVFNFFVGIFSIVSIVILLYRMRDSKAIIEIKLVNFKIFSMNWCTLLFLIFVIPPLVVMKGQVFSYDNIKNTFLTRFSNYGNYVKQLENEPKGLGSELSKSFIDIIGKDTVSIYPINLLYSRNHELNLIPLYSMQAYSGYTPWLDKKSAEKYDFQKGPQYIIFSLETIDDRYPLIEMPKTWTTVYSNYQIELVDQDRGVFLLKKRQNQLFTEENMTFIEKKKFNKDEVFIIKDNNTFIKLKAKLSIKGVFKNLFYKINAVNMTLKYEDGRIITKRVILQNFKNGFFISSIPSNNFEFINFMNGNRQLSKVKEISFSGKGLDYFKDNFDIEIYHVDMPTDSISFNIQGNSQLIKQTRSVSEFNIVGTVDAEFCVDEKQSSSNLSHIRGWIYDKSIGDEFLEVYIKSGDVIIPLKKTNREDVVKYFNLEHSSPNVGFEVYVLDQYFDKEFDFLVKPREGFGKDDFFIVQKK